ncbi:hypothetical protein [Bartonella sp. AA9NXGY]|uniref:hypothetical protein n=1 Tax=Bartonella sp. AA9NXGY TaxID=3243443 RepID=UPI0035D0449A
MCNTMALCIELVAGGRIPYQLDIPVLITSAIMFFSSITAAWYYDVLLLHLTSAEYELILFQ